MIFFKYLKMKYLKMQTSRKNLILGYLDVGNISGLVEILETLDTREDQINAICCMLDTNLETQKLIVDALMNVENQTINELITEMVGSGMYVEHVELNLWFEDTFF